MTLYYNPRGSKTMKVKDDIEKLVQAVRQIKYPDSSKYKRTSTVRTFPAKSHTDVGNTYNVS